MDSNSSRVVSLLALAIFLVIKSVHVGLSEGTLTTTTSIESTAANSHFTTVTDVKPTSPTVSVTTSHGGTEAHNGTSSTVQNVVTTKVPPNLITSANNSDISGVTTLTSETSSRTNSRFTTVSATVPPTSPVNGTDHGTTTTAYATVNLTTSLRPVGNKTVTTTALTTETETETTMVPTTAGRRGTTVNYSNTSDVTLANSTIHATSITTNSTPLSDTTPLASTTASSELLNSTSTVSTSADSTTNSHSQSTAYSVSATQGETTHKNIDYTSTKSSSITTQTPSKLTTSSKEATSKEASTAQRSTVETHHATSAFPTGDNKEDSEGKNSIAIGVGVTFGILVTIVIIVVAYVIDRRRRRAYSVLSSSINFENPLYQATYQNPAEVAERGATFDRTGRVTFGGIPA